MVTNRNDDGSVSVEAAFTMPIFALVLISLIYLISFIYNYELVQESLDKTARELSDYAYLYHEKGIAEISDLIKGKTNDYSNKIINNAVCEIIDNIVSLNDDIKQKVSTNVSGFISNAVNGYINGTIDKADDSIYVPFAMILFNSYYNPDIQVDNLSLSDSEFFNDENKIKLVLNYKITIPIPFLNIKTISVRQVSVINAWINGIGILKSEKYDDIWSLDNFQRGRILRERFGANLPDSFPTLSYFSGGSAKILKSIDITAESYQSFDGMVSRIEPMINDMARYTGQETPWGKERIVIHNKDIKERVLVIIIPENELNDNQKKAFDHLQSISKTKGVIMQIERYGKKRIS